MQALEQSRVVEVEGRLFAERAFDFGPRVRAGFIGGARTDFIQIVCFLRLVTALTEFTLRRDRPIDALGFYETAAGSRLGIHHLENGREFSEISNIEVC